jgi:hypothetical protein
LWVASAVAGVSPSQISGQFKSGDLPNFNADAQAPSFAPNAVRQALQGNVSRFGYRSQFDAHLGTTFLWAGKQDNQANFFAAGLSGQALIEARARHFLQRHADALGLTSQSIAEAEQFEAQDQGKGPVIARFRQKVRGVEVFAHELNVVTDQRGRLVAISGYFVPRTDSASLRAPAFSLSAPKAIAAAFADLGGVADDAYTATKRENGYQFYKATAARGDLQMVNSPRVKQVYFGLGADLVPAYYVEIWAASRDEARQADYGYVVSAVDGSVLFRKNQQDHEVNTYRAFADTDTVGQPFDEPLGNNAIPFPKPTYTDPVKRTDVKSKLVTLDASSLISTGDAWLPTGATVTTGNNVDAYLDLAAPNGYTAAKDVRPTNSAPNTFDYAIVGDTDPSVATTRKAAAVNLFYMNNWLHDFWYDAGFNEAAGNAQKDNFGRGGKGNDPILAEGQDYSGRNNANMSTPADGGSPRMQMYLFDGIVKGEFTVTKPKSLAGSLTFSTAAFGPTTFDLTQPVVLIDDGTAPTSDGCTAAVNGSALAGKIAMIDRGTCAFTVKVKNAQLAGAVGTVIVDNVPGESPITMGGTDGTITIPAMMISKEDGDSLKASTKPVTAHMRRDPSLDLDGTLDEGVIAHEYFHHVSNRLVGNASGLSNNQGGGMGEGWSDFSTMMLQVRPSDLKVASNAHWAGAYAVGVYVTNEFYFGIRRAPYSTDFTKNPLTFKHIQNGVALPTTAPLAFGQDGSNNAEVHNTGEVWCNMLWEAYAGFLNDGRYSFDQARAKVQQYVIAGLKLTPSQPTLVEARDGILAAADATDDADFTIWATAFAKRGMGLNAIAPPRNSTTNVGVTESYIVQSPTP